MIRVFSCPTRIVGSHQISKPFSAAFKALSTSVGDALDAFPIISSFAGFITSYVSPDTI